MVKKYNKNIDNEKWLRYQYIILKKTSRKIAMEQNVGKTTILRRLKKYNIPGRSINMSDQFGEKNLMFGKEAWNKGKKLSEKTKQKLKDHHADVSGDKNPNWNPDRAAVYAPYGENFYNPTFRQARWELQNGRCLLSGNKMNPNVRHEYHHIDGDKTNDNPDNHVHVSSHFHRIVHTKRKWEYYKKILIQNLKDLKNGKAPKSWSEKNRLLYQQEMKIQTDLDKY